MTVIESADVCPCCGGPIIYPLQYACTACWSSSDFPQPVDLDGYVDDLVDFYEYRDKL